MVVGLPVGDKVAVDVGLETSEWRVRGGGIVDDRGEQPGLGSKAMIAKVNTIKKVASLSPVGMVEFQARTLCYVHNEVRESDLNVE